MGTTEFEPTELPYPGSSCSLLALLVQHKGRGGLLALFKQLLVFKVIYKDAFSCFLTCESEDASQTSGTSGQETHEGSDRSGAAGSLRGVRSVSHDEQQPRFQEHHEQEVSISAGSLLPVQRVGGGLRHPREGPRGLVGQTGLKLSVG